MHVLERSDLRHLVIAMESSKEKKKEKIAQHTKEYEPATSWLVGWCLTTVLQS